MQKSIICAFIIFFATIADSKIVGEIFDAQIEICEINFPVKISQVLKLSFNSDDMCGKKLFFHANDIDRTYHVECRNNFGNWLCYAGHDINIRNVIMTCYDSNIESCYISADVREVEDSITFFVMMLFGITFALMFALCF